MCNVVVGLRATLRPALFFRRGPCHSLSVKAARFSLSQSSTGRYSQSESDYKYSQFSSPTFSRIARFAGVTLAVGTISSFASSPAQCQESLPRPSARDWQAGPPPPESIVNVYELSFGTVAGITVGVFVKKGAKAVAFFVGGIFVLLQYFNSMNLVRVNWTQVSRRFENLFYTVESDGTRRAPNMSSLWNWLVDFLTADFQPRATFIAGLLLGLRIG